MKLEEALGEIKTLKEDIEDLHDEIDELKSNVDELEWEADGMRCAERDIDNMSDEEIISELVVRFGGNKNIPMMSMDVIKNVLTTIN